MDKHHSNVTLGKTGQTSKLEVSLLDLTDDGPRPFVLFRNLNDVFLVALYK